jgi:hypothetical protein
LLARAYEKYRDAKPCSGHCGVRSAVLPPVNHYQTAAGGFQAANDPWTGQRIQRSPDANASGVICASIELRGGTQRAAFDYIDERIRDNTRLVLVESRRSGDVPRVAVMALAQKRVHAAAETRRWA